MSPRCYRRGSIAMHSGSGLTRSVAMGQLSDDQIEDSAGGKFVARGIQKLRGNLFYAFGYNLLVWH